jgi:hypothetical protein
LFAFEAPGTGARNPLDVLQAQRIEIVQGFRWAFRIPPTAREGGEFGEFRGIGITSGRLHVILRY